MSTLAEIYKEALIEIIDLIGEPFSDTSGEVVRVAKEALSPSDFEEDDPRVVTPDFIPGASPPVNPEEAEKHHIKHMEHLLEKSGVPAVHYLAAAVKHLLANAFALGKMSDEHAGRLNRIENMVPTGRVDHLLEGVDNLLRRVAALEETTEVVPPDRRPSFRIQKLEDHIVELERRLKAIEYPRAAMQDRIERLEHKTKQIDELEDTLTQDFDTLRARGDVHDTRMKKLEESPAMYNGPLSELINMFIHARGSGALPEGELKEVLKSLQRRLVQPRNPSPEPLVFVSEDNDWRKTTAPGCECAQIMAADRTRHFRGCPLREKYPDHPAHVPTTVADASMTETPSRLPPVLHYDCPIHGLRLSACCEGARRREPKKSVPTVARMIVCLCGSTRFSRAFAEANLEETLKGNIVLTVGNMMHSSDADTEVCVRCCAIDRSAPCLKGYAMHQFEKLTSPWHADTKKALDELHKKKIELADEVFVLNGFACSKCKRAPNVSNYCLDGTRSPHDFVPYIGDSTKSEIAHAIKLGKPLRFLNRFHFDRVFWTSIGVSTVPHENFRTVMPDDTITFRVSYDGRFHTEGAIAIVHGLDQWVVGDPRPPKIYLVVWNKKLNVWTMPGGAVEPGEDPKHAATRELLEETGAVAREPEMEFCFVGPGTVDPHVQVHAWLTPIKSQPMPRETEAGSPIKWVKKETLIEQPHVGDYYKRLFANALVIEKLGGFP